MSKLAIFVIPTTEWGQVGSELTPELNWMQVLVTEIVSIVKHFE